MQRDTGTLQSDVRKNCCILAHNKLGPIREERTLREALAEYERIEREDVPTMRLDKGARTSDKVRGEELESALSVRNLALLGRILATAALARTESRGAHFRLDHPGTDDAHWRAVTRLQLGAKRRARSPHRPRKGTRPVPRILRGGGCEIALVLRWRDRAKTKGPVGA
jgi:succinate dehydrogenase/fumarate reductase flavoprotein subunit